MMSSDLNHFLDSLHDSAWRGEDDANSSLCMGRLYLIHHLLNRGYIRIKHRWVNGARIGKDGAIEVPLD